MRAVRSRSMLFALSGPVMYLGISESTLYAIRILQGKSWAYNAMRMFTCIFLLIEQNSWLGWRLPIKAMSGRYKRIEYNNMY